MIERQTSILSILKHELWRYPVSGQIPLFSPLLLHDLWLPFHWYEINLNPLIQCDRDSLKHRPRYCLIIIKQTSQEIAQPVP